MKIPTREELSTVIENAIQAGNKTADKAYASLPHRLKSGEPWGDPGGAFLILEADGRTKIGKFVISLINDPIPNLVVERNYVYYGGGYFLRLRYPPTPYQTRSVFEAREQAAAKVISDAFGWTLRVHDFGD